MITKVDFILIIYGQVLPLPTDQTHDYPSRLQRSRVPLREGEVEKDEGSKYRVSPPGRRGLNPIPRTERGVFHLLSVPHIGKVVICVYRDPTSCSLSTNNPSLPRVSLQRNGNKRNCVESQGFGPGQVHPHPPPARLPGSRSSFGSGCPHGRSSVSGSWVRRRGWEREAVRVCSYPRAGAKTEKWCLWETGLWQWSSHTRGFW